MNPRPVFSKLVLHTAISAILFSQTNVFAGTCTETSTAVFTCSGIASNNGTDTAVSIDSTAVTITTAENFGIHAEQTVLIDDFTKYVPTIKIISTGGIQFNDIHTAPSLIQSKEQESVLSITNNGGGDIVVNSNAQIIGDIFITNTEYGNHIDVNLSQVSGSSDIFNKSSTGHLNITTNKALNSSRSEPIYASHLSTGTFNITTNGDVTAADQESPAIAAYSKQSPINLTVNKNIDGNEAIKTSPALKIINPGFYSALDTAATITINQDSFVHSITDKAIFSRSAATINNHGRIFGQMTLSEEADQFNNGTASIFSYRYNSYLDIRNFTRQSTIDEKRKIQDKTVVDFNLENDTFNNHKNGSLRLASTTDETNFTASTNDNNTPTLQLNTTYSVSNTDITSVIFSSIGGVEHGFLVNLEHFNHAGSISMADIETGKNIPIAGDVLMITSRDSNLMGATTSDFKSNGGELHLDAILDINDSGLSKTDILILDNASLGTAPTKIIVHNANGTGANTGASSTDGLMIVRVLGNSDPNAFALKNPAIAGNYNYRLVQADGQNWYLQSVLSNQSTSSLNIGTITGLTGTTVALPIQLNSNTDIANLQFDLTYDANLFSIANITNGVNIGSASTSFSQISPNVIRVTVSNQTVLNDGGLINVNVAINANTTKGAYPIEINNVQLSDSNFNNLFLPVNNVQSGQINVESEISTASIGINNATATMNSNLSLPLNFSNNDAGVALEFDLSFDNTVFSMVEPSTGINTGTAKINARQLNNSTYHYTITDFDLNNLNNGVLANLNFKVNNNATSGNYALSLTNSFLLSASGGALMPTGLNNAMITVGNLMPGDANADNMIDVRDILKIIDLILNNEMPNNADCNQDGSVNIADILCVISSIQNQP